MRRDRKRNKYMLLLLLLLGIGIGYAALSTTLKIDGQTIINKNTWSVYWDNAIVNQDSVNPSNIPVIGSNIKPKKKMRIILLLRGLHI